MSTPAAEQPPPVTLRPFDWVKIVTADLDQPNVGVVRQVIACVCGCGDMSAEVTTSFRVFVRYPLAELEPLAHRPAPRAQDIGTDVELVEISETIPGVGRVSRTVEVPRPAPPSTLLELGPEWQNLGAVGGAQ